MSFPIETSLAPLKAIDTNVIPHRDNIGTASPVAWPKLSKMLPLCNELDVVIATTPIKKDSLIYVMNTPHCCSQMPFVTDCYVVIIDERNFNHDPFGSICVNRSSTV